MILVAENDTDSRNGLINLIASLGFKAEGADVDAKLEDRIAGMKPECVVACIPLHKESEEFRLVHSLTDSPVLESIPLIIGVESAVPEKSGVRRKNTEQIRCNSFFDKPVDIFEVADILTRHVIHEVR